jgi:hypothetical protein
MVLVRRNHHHVEIVDLLELRRFGVGGAGHAGQLVVHPEIILKGDGGQGLIFLFDLDPLLGLQRLVQAVAVTAALHGPAGELIDDDHLAVLDDIIHVALEKAGGPSGPG